VTVREAVVDATGAAAPPRRNGELVFEAPWESRAFGIALALHGAGALDFEAFRACLIDEIQSWQVAHPGSAEGWGYYERWERALERALTERGLVTPQEIESRAAAIAHARAHGHDHKD
jgi:nitrile hydratase accessory protein